MDIGKDADRQGMPLMDEIRQDRFSAAHPPVDQQTAYR